jgi:predicted DNA-binding transcriptional regulator YafY
MDHAEKRKIERNVSEQRTRGSEGREAGQAGRSDRLQEAARKREEQAVTMARVRAIVEALRAIHSRSGAGLPQAEARQQARLDFAEARKHLEGG